MGICGGVRQTTADNMAHAHCVLDDEGYGHVLRICNIYGLARATVVTRTLLNVTFIGTYTACVVNVGKI